MEDSGVYEGLESVTRFWITIFDDDKIGAGHLAIHMTVNPVIEISPDRTRAKGLWHSHGYCSLPMEGALKQFLCLGKYDMEYVKEDGRWKILKFAYRQTFMCPYEEGLGQGAGGGQHRGLSGQPPRQAHHALHALQPLPHQRVRAAAPGAIRRLSRR